MKLETIELERKKGSRLYMQIYQKLRREIEDGRLKKGDQLPSIRTCEKLLSVSKTSVERAYGKLMEEGYITAVAQKGYFVDVARKEALLRKQMRNVPQPVARKTIRYDFRSQTMDNAMVEGAVWKRYVRDVLDRCEELASYGDARGERELRLALQNYAYTMRGVLAEEAAILVGSSFQSLLYILCGMLPRKSVIAMSERSVLQAQRVFEDFGFSIRYIKEEADGVCMRQLDACGATVFYINSGSYGSLRQPISYRKRRELLQWAERRQVLLLEDDHNGELRYSGKLQPSLQSMDMGKQVVYIGSFSRILPPAFRISYLVLNEELQKEYEKRADMYAPTSGKIEQLALAHYIADGHLRRQVRRLSRRYEQKSKQMIKLLKAYFPSCSLYLEEAALQLLVSLPSACAEKLQAAAKEEGILFEIVSNKELLLSFAAIPSESMEDALLALYRLYERWK